MLEINVCCVSFSLMVLCAGELTNKYILTKKARLVGAQLVMCLEL